jgi:hypothetical protein
MEILSPDKPMKTPFGNFTWECACKIIEENKIKRPYKVGGIYVINGAFKTDVEFELSPDPFKVNRAEK